jgi:hypothetical protein
VIWSFYLEHLDLEAVKRILAETFSIAVGQVDCATELIKLGCEPGSLGVVVWSNGGRFGTTVEIYAAHRKPLIDQLTLAKRIAAELPTSLLISDETDKTYDITRVILIQPDGQTTRARLDPTPLHNDEMYLLEHDVDEDAQE